MQTKTEFTRRIGDSLCFMNGVMGHDEIFTNVFINISLGRNLLE